LTASQHVTILATSREPLGVSGEATCAAPALSLPSALSTPSMASLMKFEGTRLFVARAMAAAPGLAWSDNEAGAVALICRQLDGMPLAIELAAARLNVLSVRQIAEHLQDRFNLLKSPSQTAPHRQQSLRAAIEWSYDLLSGDEQGLLRCLSVFVAGSSLEGAVALFGGERPKLVVLDLLARLVEKSLLVVDRTSGEPRYRILETIRLYAWERLLQRGEQTTAVRRYISFVRGFVEDVGTRFLTCQPQADVEIMVEYDNIRSAMRWCLDTGSLEEGMRIAAPLWALNKSEDVAEPGEWLEAMLVAPGDVPPQVRGKATAARGMTVWWQGRFEQAWNLAQDAVSLCDATGDTPSLAFATEVLGRCAHVLGNMEATISNMERSLRLYRQLGFAAGALRPLLFLGQALQVKGESERARCLFDEGLLLARQMDCTWGKSFALCMLGGLAQANGDAGQDVSLCRQALTVCVTNGYTREVGIVFAMLADAFTASGHPQKAAVTWGAAYAAADRFHMFLNTGLATFRFAMGDQDARLAGLRAYLGEPAFHELVARGRDMPFDQAVAYALASP
jgi:predicted ATPase